MGSGDMKVSYYAGVDIGSTTSKAVILDDSMNILSRAILFTSFNRDQSGQDVLEDSLEKAGLSLEDLTYVMATGYGRRALSLANDVLPEIICHGKGTVQFYPGTRTIVDIGGQDSKVIEMDEDSTISKFEMNDKCAAGTGRFFEVLTQRLLHVSMEELGPLALKSENPCTISSMCTIFAETEIISFMSQGLKKEDISMGMNLSIVKRIIAMAKAGQIKFKEPIVFSGGVAKNVGVKVAFERLLGKKVDAIENPQFTGAYGAAISAIRKHTKPKTSKA